jgi:rhodanese-related sulfurtransferase
MEVAEITPKEAFELIIKDSILLDVREEQEVVEQAYGVENLIHIPLGQLPDRLAEIPMDKEVIVGCRSGARSYRATEFLLHHGYNNVKNLKFGILGWAQDGLPTK